MYSDISALFQAAQIMLPFVSIDFLLLTLVFALPSPDSFENNLTQLLGPQPNRVTWAAMSDSWASGVCYGNLAYKGDSTWLRIKDAYAVQLSEDKTWYKGLQDFKFVACSGARIINAKGQDIDMTIPDDGKTPVRRRYATMHFGGNDAGFYDIAVDCFYQPIPSLNAYGPPYPSENSACKKALKRVRENIQGASAHNDPNHVNVFGAINSIMDWQPEEDANPDFDLYVIGYAAFFNIDDSSTWCNDQSFRVIPFIHKPLLSLVLRRKVNQLTLDLNRLFQQVLTERNDKHVHYIDPNPNFDGHRWCEPDQTSRGDLFNYDGCKAWFFNSQIPKDVPSPCIRNSPSPIQILDFNVP